MRSIAGKVDIQLDIIPLNGIGVPMLVETWHDDGSVALQRLRRAGYSVVDRPRPRGGRAQKSLLTNHGNLTMIATEVNFVPLISTVPRKLLNTWQFRSSQAMSTSTS